MDGIVWLFLSLTVALLALGVVLVRLRREASGVDPPRHCSSCQTPMSLRRASLFQSLTLRGTWTCPHCGTRIKTLNRLSGLPRSD
jgi:hypothetical protein